MSEGWRRAADDTLLELSALSQSARLTREQIRLHAELTPYLALLDATTDFRTQHRQELLAIVDAIDRDDPDDASAATSALVATVIESLIQLQDQLRRSKQTLESDSTVVQQPVASLHTPKRTGDPQS